jgi:hypothetical protein
VSQQGLAFAVLVLALPPALASEPSVTGQTGLISMPDARLEPEGSLRTGLSFLRPYQTLWSSLTVFPWFEGSFRYTRIYHVPGFAGTPDNPSYGVGYGDFKDKAFDAKVLLFPERSGWPSLVAGMQDAGGGTGVFSAPYGVASKRFGELDLTLGYGRKRIDGVFGGVRWSPSALPSWSLVAEYDAFDYKDIRTLATRSVSLISSKSRLRRNWQSSLERLPLQTRRNAWESIIFQFFLSGEATLATCWAV